jgi:predicted DNA binding protein
MGKSTKSHLENRTGDGSYWVITILRIEFQVQSSKELKRLSEIDINLKRIELDNAIYAGQNTWLEFLTVTPVSNIDLKSELADHPNVEIVGATPVTEESTVWYILALVEESGQFVLEAISTSGAVPHRISVEGGQLKAIVSVRDWDHLKEFAEKIESTYGSFELIGTTQVDGLTYPLGTGRLKRTVRGNLTEEQLYALETSFQMGYYTVPQTATSEEVANHLNISQSTLSAKLRNAQYNLLEVLFGTSDEDQNHQ